MLRRIEEQKVRKIVWNFYQDLYSGCRETGTQTLSSPWKPCAKGNESGCQKENKEYQSEKIKKPFPGGSIILLFSESPFKQYTV